MKYQDTYFLNANEALKVASLQNKSDDGYILQLCYYEGEAIESDFVNLVHLPLETLGDDLINGRYRIPSKLDFTGLELSPEVKLDVQLHFNMTIEQAKVLRNEKNEQYYKTLKNAQPNFNEPLRFYLTANNNTRVMQHITQNIVNALLKSNIDVLFDLYYGIEDSGSLKKLSEFNPHATININHLNNHFLNDNIFNFVWVQDHFALEQFESTKLRSRDVIYHLIEHYGGHLNSININSTLQPFCIDRNIYKMRKKIKREKKIVFIGSSYKKNFDDIDDDRKYAICDELFSEYLKNGYIASKRRLELNEKYALLNNGFGHMMNYIERDLTLAYIINMHLDYEIDVYGYGWESIKDITLKNKGPIAYGEDISKIYNSAKYCLVIGGYVMQQRTLEGAASGSIPLIFDSRESEADDIDDSFENSVLFMKKLDDLPNILNTKQSFNLEKIVDENSYDNFAKKMIDNMKFH